MTISKQLLQERLAHWQKELRKFQPTRPLVFKFNSKNLADRQKVDFLLKEIAAIQGSCIYRILISDIKYCSRIKQCFGNFWKVNNPKPKGEKRHVSRFIKNDSCCLYVGSKRSKVNDRIKQHFGYGPARTYSLSLSYWFPPKVDLILEVYPVKVGNELLVMLEQSMWEGSKPMFGKQSGL